jgi:ADP-ribose pyrophosphatase
MHPSPQPPELTVVADEDLRGTVVGTEILHRGRLGDFRIDTVRFSDGRESSREILGHPGAVAIVALDPEDRVLLVRQWRTAAGRILLEIPAGTLDLVDPVARSIEDPGRAARRELEEETGYRATTWRKLAAFWTVPGFATELMHLYLATDLSPALGDRLGPDEDERLELVRLPWAEAGAAVERGDICDAKSIVGLFWLARLKSSGQA